jgi:hypothetical protein
METSDFIKKYLEIDKDFTLQSLSFDDAVKICDAFANEFKHTAGLLINENNRLKSENLDKETKLFLQGVKNKEVTNRLITEISVLKKEQSQLPVTIKENMTDTAIIITCYNESRFIKKQVDLIRRFHNEQVDIIIVDNSTDSETVDQIKYYNKEMGCIYMKTNASSKNGSESHSFSLNLSYHIYKNDYKYIMYLDHDAFPTHEFSIKEMIGDNIITGMGQRKGEIEYFWPGCVMWNNEAIDRNLIDFSCSHDLGLDTGGLLYRVIEAYGKEKCPFLNEKHVQNPNFNKSMYDFYSEINDGMFLHMVNGSNWNPSEGHDERINSLLNILESKTNG